MEDGLSLRPLTLRPGAAGPGKNPFASFGRGAGASLAKKVRLLHDAQACWAVSEDPSMKAMLHISTSAHCHHRPAVQPQDVGPAKVERKKPPGEIIRYEMEFLLKFQEASLVSVLHLGLIVMHVRLMPDERNVYCESPQSDDCCCTIAEIHDSPTGDLCPERAAARDNRSTKTRRTDTRSTGTS